MCSRSRATSALTTGTVVLLWPQPQLKLSVTQICLRWILSNVLLEPQELFTTPDNVIKRLCLPESTGLTDLLIDLPCGVTHPTLTDDFQVKPTTKLNDGIHVIRHNDKSIQIELEPITVENPIVHMLGNLRILQETSAVTLIQSMLDQSPKSSLKLTSKLGIQILAESLKLGSLPTANRIA